MKYRLGYNFLRQMCLLTSNPGVSAERILAMELGKEVSVAKWVEVNLPEVLYAKALKEMGLEDIDDLHAIWYIELYFKIAECNQDKAISILKEVIKKKQDHFNALLLAGIIEYSRGCDNNNYELTLQSEIKWHEKQCKKLSSRVIPSEFFQVRSKKLLAHDITARASKKGLNQHSFVARFLAPP